MSIMELGALGEFFGAIAVVITLVYLATQLRQNTNALRSSTYQAYNESSFSWADSMVENAAQIGAILQHDDFESLDPEERFTCDAFLLKSFTIMESSYLHHRAGSLDDDVFEAKMRGSEVFLAATPLARQRWDDAFDTFGITQEFKDYMDGRLKALA